MSDLKKQIDALPNDAVKRMHQDMDQLVAGHNLSHCMDCKDPEDKKGKSKSKNSSPKSDSKPKNSKPKSDSGDKKSKSDDDSGSDDSKDNDSESDSGSFEQFGQKESAGIAKFLQSMTEKNYAEANKYLQDVVNLKIAQQIRNTQV